MPFRPRHLRAARTISWFLTGIPPRTDHPARILLIYLERNLPWKSTFTF